MKKEQPIEKQDNSMLLKDLYIIVQELLQKGELPEAGESYLWVIGLSEHQQLLLMELLSASSLDTLSSNEVFQVPLQKRAAFVLLCQRPHNQEWTLGEQELVIIRQLLQVGYLISLPILDYLLLKEEGYYSLVESGELGEWEPIQEETSLTIKNAEELAQKAVEQAKHTLEASYYQDKEEIALHLYEEGLDLEQIITITGLSEATLLLLLDISQ